MWDTSARRGMQGLLYGFLGTVGSWAIRKALKPSPRFSSKGVTLVESFLLFMSGAG